MAATIEPLMSAAEVAKVLGIPQGTLYQWRHRGKGPRGLRVGRWVKYAPADVRAWIDEQRAHDGDAA